MKNLLIDFASTSMSAAVVLGIIALSIHGII